jgi:hypothetical protein
MWMPIHVKPISVGAPPNAIAHLPAPSSELTMGFPQGTHVKCRLTALRAPLQARWKRTYPSEDPLEAWLMGVVTGGSVVWVSVALSYRERAFEADARVRSKDLPTTYHPIVALRHASQRSSGHTHTPLSSTDTAATQTSLSNTQVTSAAPTETPLPNTNAA